MYSQISTPGKPESFKFMNKRAVQIPLKYLNSIDTSYLLAEEKEKAIPNRYGIVQHIRIDIKEEGLATKIDGKGTIWQYELKSEEASSIGIRFSSFHLPDGASVFIYNEDHNRVAGAFTSIDNLSIKQLPIADFMGKNAIIEYFEPFNTTFPGELIIGSVALAYKKMFINGIDRIGINCPAGANWQDVKHSVCLMTFNDSLYLFYCTGFLVNNVREDGTPYFQTASHCLNNNSMAATLVTFFNYEEATCGVDSILFSPSLSGATVIANSAYSDFSLLMLSQYPPKSYLPYYAGWNANIQYAESGTCIHHPSRLTKCISFDTIPPRNYPFSINWHDSSSYPISEPGTHWEVLFSRGSIESGSSGAPLFNENQLVIGQLHGGTSVDGFFGKFNLSWDYKNSVTQQLKYWLDPDSTGAYTLEGTFLSKRPRASFSAKVTHACNGATIRLRDFSKYAPNQWRWSVSPSGYQFVNGTDSTSRNPEIVFNNAGKFSVTLIATNGYGSDTLTRTDYINSIYIHVQLSGLPLDKVVCGCNLKDYALTASDAINYTFSIEKKDKISMKMKQDSVFLTLNPGENKNGSFNSWIRVTGTNESCISFDSTLIEISIPVNDDIENAIALIPGRNPSYTNFCASVQQNEPNPPAVSCYSQMGWCPEDSIVNQVLHNTIWFWFKGPANGFITIDTHGFNDRIAVYSADSAGSIISGNQQTYTLIAANDDRSVSDATALLQNIRVEPYKTYWLQVDGSNSSTGNCTIDLLSNSIEVYPNPSTGTFNIILSFIDSGIADVEIFSSMGTMVYSDHFEVTHEANNFSFDISSLPRGFYFMQARINGTLTKARLMLIR
jgi:PKD repeat protein